MKIKYIYIFLLLVLSYCATAQDLVLRKSDIILVSISGVPVEEQEQINKSYPINSQGQVRLPYINPISAAGIGADTLAQRIEWAYKKQQIFSRPRVTVTTPEEETPQRRISVAGEVNKPGIQPYQNNLTILEAIAQAGNPTPYANMKKVKLIRGGTTTQMDLRNISKYPERDIRLEPGDKIIISE